jgi:NADH dehydrogenase
MSQLARTEPQPCIVIVGGGAGGLELATRLGRQLGAGRQARIVLVDGSPTHIWKPLLHEVATGALNTGEDEVNYFAHAYRNGYEFELGYMQALDRQQRRIRLAPVTDEQGEQLAPARDIGYDWLVLAVGAEANDFGTPGVREHCLFLNTPADAERLRKQLLALTFRASANPAGVQPVRVSIVGGGATGVELAAEMHHTVCELHQYGARLSPADFTLRIIEGAGRILATAPESLSHYATDELQKRHIEVLANSLVKRVDADAIELADGRRVASDLCVWAAGVKAPAWLAGLDGLPVNKVNQLLVDTRLQTADPRVLAIGDCAAAPDGEGGRPLAATAQVAHQQARYLARELPRRLRGQGGAPFVFKPQGMMVSLGKNKAVGSLAAVVGPKRNYHVEGRSAKLIYVSLYRMHQAAVHGWLLATLLFIGDKLRGVARPTLKLH